MAAEALSAKLGVDPETLAEALDAAAARGELFQQSHYRVAAAQRAASRLVRRVRRPTDWSPGSRLRWSLSAPKDASCPWREPSSSERSWTAVLHSPSSPRVRHRAALSRGSIWQRRWENPP